jgi:hypothetical protein
VADLSTYDPIFKAAGDEWNVDPRLLKAVATQESGGNPRAVSGAGAQGLMQIIPATQKYLGVTDPYDPVQSIFGAAKYLDRALRVEGSPEGALLNYHGGDGWRQAYGKESAGYVPAVTSHYVKLGASPGAEAQPTGAGYRTLLAAATPRTATDANVGATPAAAVPTGAGNAMPKDETDAEFLKRTGAVTGGAASVDDDAAFLARTGATPASTTAAATETAPAKPDQPWWQTAANYAAGTVGAFKHGLSFGLDNPLDRATAAVFPNSAFAKQQQEREQAQKQFQEAHPLASGAAEVAGSIPTFLMGEGALAKVIPPVAGAGLVDRGLNLLGASARGGIVSAAAGAGMSEGDLADRGKAAAESGAFGVAMPPLFSAVGSVLRGTVAPIAARIIPGSAERQATSKVAQALARDRVTPTDVQANLTQLGPEAGMVDAGGTNVRRLGETVANVPGPNAEIAETFLEGRAAGQQGRINTAIKAATGSPGEFYDVLDELGRQRSTAAKPLYDKAFGDTVVSPQDAAELRRFVSDRVGQSALQRGMRSLELENLAANKPFNPADYGVTRDESGTWALQGGQPNLRLFDAVKRGLDSVAEEFRNPTTGQMDFAKYDDRFGSGRAVDSVRKAYVGELRSRFPDYAAALDAWSGPSRAIDALSMGRRALANDPEVSAKAIGGLSENEKEFFKAGVARALKDKAESVQDGADATRRIFGNQLIRDKIAAAFGDTSAFNEFQRTMESEAAFARSRNEVLKSSATARRLAGQTDIDILSPAIMAAHGHLVGAATNIGGQALNALSQASGDPVKAAIARQLFTSREPASEYLNALQRAQNPRLGPVLRAGAAMGGVNALNNRR